MMNSEESRRGSHERFHDAVEVVAPPVAEGADGRPRGVGVELEFGQLTAFDAARAVTRALGPGSALHEEDPHRFRITPPAGSPWRGSFRVELDTRWAHPEHLRRHVGNPDESEEDNELPRLAAAFLGDVAGLVMPVELVAPPVGWPDLPALMPLITGLRAAGATGTEHSTFAGFGMHLNVEAAAYDAEYLLSVLRAYVLIAPRLRRDSRLATIRRMQNYINPFAVDYARHILDAGYAPELGRLIDDYIAFNPTRNMELDMLPLFAHLDAPRVRRRLPDEKISARPTFHWRLPDCRIDAPGWRPMDDWTRWVEVERLATQPLEIRALSRTFLSKGPRWEIEARLARIAESFE
ncbi:amidoligase family protein [Limibaculum sp. M0105]|uniref:Amidoligase family protein n=1 Tax=Thermohalobaculum xanthum TaxID=2753746 RepID=A0A8J7M6B8_9RHOB|nr:amidoligase family protein [Thermohalobaculum xanthum]MBK0399371.1 amidoligase family protein [Thermohalobaculum xanthum]